MESRKIFMEELTSIYIYIHTHYSITLNTALNYVLLKLSIKLDEYINYIHIRDFIKKGRYVNICCYEESVTLNR